MAAQHRKYLSFQGFSQQSCIDGIKFWTSKNVEIINFPKQHSLNMTTKHQATQCWLKPVLRIFKNMRSTMVEKYLIDRDTAPSYYIEGLLYNVPPEKFGGSYVDSVVNSLNWIMEQDRSKFVCANEQYFLCHPTSPVTWRAEKREAFLAGVINLWKNW